MWGAIAAVGGAFGLLLSGILTDVPVVAVDLLRRTCPVGIAAALLALRFIPVSRAEQRPELASTSRGAVSVTPA